jgi:hypothetical protein
MLLNCGSINNREIFYSNIGDSFNEVESFPSKNWLLFAIAEKAQARNLYTFAEKCLDRGVLYVCGAGEACSDIDDAFDSVMVDRKLASLNRDLTQDDFQNSPMTTWHHDFDEGFWFSVKIANHETELINKVVVANLTTGNFQFRIKELIEKIQLGWLPSD